MRIAIIGAGIAGLAAARELQAADMPVTVYDKARGPGGRFGSKRTPHGPMDLGAQYFTARDPAFREAVSEWQSAGVIAPWSVTPMVLPERQPARPEIRLVAVPRMSALARHMAEGLYLETGVQISEITRELGGWVLRERHGKTLGEFDAVIVTAPAPQAQSLLAEPTPMLATAAGTARMQPCWSVGLVLETPLNIDVDAGFPSSGPLRWIARAGSRPQRPHSPEIWTLHATPAWSEANIEWSPEAAGEFLAEAFSELIRRSPSVKERIAHRWRFAQARNPLGDSAGFIESDDILCAGDWVADGRVEGAWHSGRAAARQLVTRAGKHSTVF